MKMVLIALLYLSSISTTLCMVNSKDESPSGEENRNTGYTQKEFTVPVKRY